MFPVVAIAVFWCGGIVFLLWCLAHFIQEGLRFSRPSVRVIKMGAHRLEDRKVFPINAGTRNRTRHVGARFSEAMNAAIEEHHDVMRRRVFRKSL